MRISKRETPGIQPAFNLHTFTAASGFTGMTDCESFTFRSALLVVSAIWNARVNVTELSRSFPPPPGDNFMTGYETIHSIYCTSYINPHNMIYYVDEI